MNQEYFEQLTSKHFLKRLLDDSHKMYLLGFLHGMEWNQNAFVISTCLDLIADRVGRFYCWETFILDNPDICCKLALKRELGI